MGFVEDIEALLDQTPSDRQTVLMSATMPHRIKSLAGRYLNDPEHCAVKADRAQPIIRQRGYLVNRRDKLAAMARIFETEEVTSALVFAKTRLGTEELAAELVQRSIPAEALHGNMTQDVRSRIVRRFREGDIKVLVGTDVAARGLDIDDISHVFNFELPSDPEVYVHRIGRTGRAGREGEAITILSPQEIGKMRRIEKFTRTNLEQCDLPTVEEIEAMRSRRVMDRVDVWVQRGRCNAERELVDKMVEEGGDPLEIAAAALRLARKAEYERPIEAISPVERRRPGKNDRRGRNGAGPSGHQSGGYNGRPRGSRKERHQSDGNMIKLSLSVGKENGVRVNNIISTMARHGGIPADAIGRVDIDSGRTLVDVKQDHAPAALKSSGKLRFGPQRVEVDLA